ncbi:MAG: hypothetical protein Q8L14_21280 [Myxococcales bacterium]|nr:hypothetical protein [Myxococcales bacterium]
MSSTFRLSTLLVVVACLGFALGLSNCGPQPCSSATCPTGCCGSTGRCETGSSSAACGRLGEACLSCSISQSCSAGTCMNQGFGAGGTGGSGTVGGGSAGGGSAGGGSAGGGSAGGGSVVGGGSTAGGAAGGSATGGGSGGGASQSCTVSGTCPVNTCICGDNAVLTSQFCNNNVCQTGASECSRACIAAGHPPPGGSGGGSAGGGSAGGGSAGGAACNGAFALGSNFTTGSELYVQCNAFPSPTNCLTGKYINFEGVSGRLAACFCYAVCPNGVTAGQVCSASTPDLICTRVRNTAGTSSALMCMPPGAAWQNLCRG